MSESGESLLCHGDNLLPIRLHKLTSTAKKCLKTLVRQDWLLLLLNRQGDCHSLVQRGFWLDQGSLTESLDFQLVCHFQEGLQRILGDVHLQEH